MKTTREYWFGGSPMISIGEVINQFKEAMYEAGIVPPEHIEADGVLHRFPTNGKCGDDAGSYVLHLDSIPAGYFRDWRNAISQHWRANIGRNLTDDETKAHRAKIASMRKAREEEERHGRLEAASKAQELWGAAQPATEEHAYLRHKGVKPTDTLREIPADRLVEVLRYVPKSRGKPLTGQIVLVPVKVGEALSTLEMIDEAGRKSAIYGGQKAGGYWAAQRLPDSDGGGLTLLIGKGVSTVLSAREASDHFAIAALSCGNLEAVARLMRDRYPRAKIIILADIGNGQNDAEEAARETGALLALPDFGRDRPEGISDINDLARLRGAEAVRAALEAARPVGNPEGAEKACGVSLTPASQLRPEPVSWLWDGYIAAGKLHVLAGAPGTGETTLAIALAATITTGGSWPDGRRAEVGDVVIWSGEDDPRDTLIPRSIACGADLDRVRFLGGVQDGERSRSFDPATDAEMLSDAIAESPPALLIVDPIVSAVAGDSHKNAEVRRSLQPLVDLAQSRRCAVLGISHFSKGSKGADPVERVTGSLAFGALARIVLATAKLLGEDGGGRLLARAKSNIGLDHGGFKYDLEVCQIDAGIHPARVLWAEALVGSARELLSRAEAILDPEERTATDEAQEWLQEVLSAGPMKAADIKKMAKQAGIQEKPLRIAREKLGIKSEKSSFSGGWRWALPPTKMPSLPKMPEGAQTGNEGILGERGHLREAAATEDARDAEDALPNGVGTFGHLRSCDDELSTIGIEDREIF